MSLKNEKDVLPPGLKTRPGLNGNQRLPQLNSLANQTNNTTINSSTTRGGAVKRTFKPKIPVKTDRLKKNEDTVEKSNTVNNKNSNKKNNDFKKNKKQKEFIQIEGTFDNFKIEPKAKTSSTYKESSYGSHSKATEFSNLKVELDCDVKKEKLNKTIDNTNLSNYMTDDEDSISDSDQDNLPISWTNYSKSINSFNNKEENIEGQLENGRLILMPCIFGTLSGQTDYKLQVLKSGKMRLVNKINGFIIDLLNTDGLENDATKEIIELDDDKLLRYGSLRNKDIFSPVRNINSDYNLISKE